MEATRIEVPALERLGKMLYCLNFTALKWEKLPEHVRKSYVRDAERLVEMMQDASFT